MRPRVLALLVVGLLAAAPAASAPAAAPHRIGFLSMRSGTAFAISAMSRAGT
jgi:ABC-type sugar transport system substrate-binding protein